MCWARSLSMPIHTECIIHFITARSSRLEFPPWLKRLYFQKQYLHSAAACRSPRLSSNQCHCTFPHSRTGSCQWNHTSTWRSCICCFLKAARKEKHFVTASLSLQQTIIKSNVVMKIKSWLFTRLDEKHHKHKKKGGKKAVSKVVVDDKKFTAEICV